MKVSTIIKWITGGLEAALGVPILGGSMIIGLAWSSLIIMGILHIVSLIFSAREETQKHGNILVSLHPLLAGFHL